MDQTDLDTKYALAGQIQRNKSNIVVATLLKNEETQKNYLIYIELYCQSTPFLLLLLLLFYLLK